MHFDSISFASGHWFCLLILFLMLLVVLMLVVLKRRSFSGANNKQKQPKETLFDDLPDEMIFNIFSRIEPTKLLNTERVSQNWQRMVRETLERNIKTVAMKKLDKSRNLCKHFANTAQVISFSIDLETKLVSRFLKLFFKKYNWFKNFITFTPRQLKPFSPCLSKLTGVCCINFSGMEITVETIVKTFELCPKLECFKISGEVPFKLINFNRRVDYKLDEDKWNDFVNRFGHRFVHVSIGLGVNCEQLFMSLVRSTTVTHLEMISFYLAEVDRKINNVIRMIQQKSKKKNVAICLTCLTMSMNFGHFQIDDNIEELTCMYEMNWNALPNDCRQLKFLRFVFTNSIAPVKSINFSALETLHAEQLTDDALQVLCSCQFPVLQKLFLKIGLFDVIADVDQRLDQLFMKMPALTKIVIENLSYSHQVPGSAISRLKHLTSIKWRVAFLPGCDLSSVIQAFQLIQQLPQLKRLSFKFRFEIGSEWPRRLKCQWHEAIVRQLTEVRKQRPGLVVELGYFDYDVA